MSRMRTGGFILVTDASMTFASPSHDSPPIAMVTALDDSVGSTVRKLKELGLYDNTIIIFSGDVITTRICSLSCELDPLYFLRMAATSLEEQAMVVSVARKSPSLKGVSDNLR